MQVARGSSESSFFVNSETKSSSLGLTLSVPLYQGGLVSSKVRQSVHRLNAEYHNLEFEEEELKRKLQRAFFGLTEAISLQNALKTAFKSAQLELDSNKKSALAGIRRQFDILFSQQKFLSVEKELIDSRISILEFWIRLNMLAGSLNEDTIELAENYLSAGG